jgi:chromosome segregation ATPase
MGRKRIASLDETYALEREVKELKHQIEKLKKQLQEKEKNAKLEPDYKKAATPKIEIKQECPKCGASVITTELPHGYLDLCNTGCGFRAVRKKK